MLRSVANGIKLSKVFIISLGSINNDFVVNGAPPYLCDGCGWFTAFRINALRKHLVNQEFRCINCNKQLQTGLNFLRYFENSDETVCNDYSSNLYIGKPTFRTGVKGKTSQVKSCGSSTPTRVFEQTSSQLQPPFLIEMDYRPAANSETSTPQDGTYSGAHNTGDFADTIERESHASTSELLEYATACAMEQFDDTTYQIGMSMIIPSITQKYGDVHEGFTSISANNYECNF